MGDAFSVPIILSCAKGPCPRAWVELGSEGEGLNWKRREARNKRLYDDL